VVSWERRMPIAEMSSKFTRLNPDSTLESKNAAIQQVMISGRCLFVMSLREKNDAREIKSTMPPMTSGVLGTKNTISIPTRIHNPRGRIRG